MELNDQHQLEQQVVTMFDRFVEDDLSVEDFAAWVYGTPELAEIIGDHVYGQFLDEEYTLPTARKEILQRITSWMERFLPGRLAQEQGKVRRERLRNFLCALVAGQIDPLEGAQTLSWWEIQGEPLLDSRFSCVEDHIGFPGIVAVWAQEVLDRHFSDRPCGKT